MYRVYRTYCDMNHDLPRYDASPRASRWVGLLVAALAALLSLPISQSAAATSVSSGASATTFPSGAEDEILLISTRALGTTCRSELLDDHLQCERYNRNDASKPSWQAVPVEQVLAECSLAVPTIIFVHGNRVERGEDRERGMMVYRSLRQKARHDGPIRFIIWSWPSTRIPRALQDYRVKAARTRPAGWQLAWFIDRLPADLPLSLVGYSYGARVASSSLHLLGGGDLGGLQLDERVHPHRDPVRVALVAAAFDASWMQPGGYHGKALSQIDQLLLLTNRHDPAMRFFHLSAKHQRPQALGLAGLPNTKAVQEMAERITLYDVTSQVGRSHALSDYLHASRPLGTVWTQICYAQPPTDGEQIATKNTKRHENL